jgi:hypothetical protein
MRHDFVFVIANDQVLEMQDSADLLLSVHYFGLALDLLSLNRDPNVLVVLVLQDLRCQTELCLGLTSFVFAS